MLAQFQRQTNKAKQQGQEATQEQTTTNQQVKEESQKLKGEKVNLNNREQKQVVKKCIYYGCFTMIPTNSCH